MSRMVYDGVTLTNSIMNLTIIQLLFQLNAHVFIIKSTRYYNLYFFVLYFCPTCFNPRGSSSEGSMPVPG
jgi:hypothetical protein